VWSTTEEAAQALVQLSDEAFAEAVTRASDGVLGQVTSVHGRGAFPLRAQYARRYTLARFALVGDAAHTVHPLAGQGVNLGLLDAAALGETLVQAHSGGRDVGDLPVLRKYERWRKGENLVMMAAVDGIGRLFGMQAAPLPALRKIGMGMVSRASPAAEFFIRRAMGLAGDLPRWAAANW
jgi:2-octaprenylphenol hydroxylase